MDRRTAWPSFRYTGGMLYFYYLFLRAMLLWLEVAELNGLLYGGLVGGFAAILWPLLHSAVVGCADFAWDFVAKSDVEGFHVRSGSHCCRVALSLEKGLAHDLRLCGTSTCKATQQFWLISKHLSKGTSGFEQNCCIQLLSPFSGLILSIRDF